MTHEQEIKKIVEAMEKIVYVLDNLVALDWVEMRHEVLDADKIIQELKGDEDV